ncbi:tetratricopeptide repeat protein [Streptomyces sp. NBC_00158]|uniref:tetratricopeptide repeat protein n=1 Tax=Streptomyces sp. NBC_00158 TaxID=2903627 RepID=UPI002F914E7B
MSAENEQRARAAGQARITQIQVAGDYYADRPPHAGVAARGVPGPPPLLVGRDEEAARLLGLLAPGGARTVVVAGLAGVGKSALAHAVAHRALAAGTFTGGALYVSLRGYAPDGGAGPEEGVIALLEQLGVRQADLPATADARLARYRSELAERAAAAERVLIVADDAGDAGQLLPLVPPGGEAHRLLVTSRDVLVTPDFTPLVVSLAELPAGPAVELLTTRIWATRPEDPRPGKEPDAPWEIAAHCGCLPIALTVAAALAAGDPGLPLGVLARRLADARTRLRTLSPRVGRDRIPTGVAAALDLSYDRLPAEEARLLRLLTLVPGEDAHTLLVSLMVAAADEQTEDEPDLHGTREQLAALARAGLLTEQPVGSDRWRMHDLVRLFAAEAGRRHAREDGRDEAAGRLLDAYEVLSTEADRGMRGESHGPGPYGVTLFHSTAEAGDFMTLECTALLGLLPLATELGRYDSVPVLFQNTWTYVIRTGRFEDCVEGARLAVAAARSLGDTTLEARLLSCLAVALERTGAQEEAERVLDEAFARHEEGAGEDSAQERAVLLGHRSAALATAGRFDEAVAASTEALALLRNTGNRAGEGEVLSNHALLLLQQGRVAEAVTAGRRAAGILTRTPHAHAAALAVRNLGSALLAGPEGREEGSRALARAAQDFADLGESREAARTMEMIATFLLQEERLAEALGAMRIAADNYALVGDTADESRVRSVVAQGEAMGRGE